MFDTLIIAADNALRTISGSSHATRPLPADGDRADDEVELGVADKALSGALMRINHVGEICAQALYQAQAMSTRDPLLRRHFEQAAREGEMPVLVCSSMARMHVRAIVERFRPTTAVMAQGEIHPRARLKTVGSL